MSQHEDILEEFHRSGRIDAPLLNVAKAIVRPAGDVELAAVNAYREIAQTLTQYLDELRRVYVRCILGYSKREIKGYDIQAGILKEDNSTILITLKAKVGSATLFFSVLMESRIVGFVLVDFEASSLDDFRSCVSCARENCTAWQSVPDLRIVLQ